MSTIQVIAKAASQAGRIIRDDQQPGIAATLDLTHSRDQDLMYPWTIGVTEAAHPHEEHSNHEQECPPEVYIG